MPAPTPASASTAGGERDLRLDLLRGCCVLLMIYGHLGWRTLEVHLRIGFVSVAEGFFLISGATLGVVAARYVARGERRLLARRLLRRGLWLYAANLVGVLVYRGLTGPLFPTDEVEAYWAGVPAAVRWLSFDQPSVLNVLPRYAAFLVFAPLALRLLERGRAALLAIASVALWLANWLSGGALRLPLFETARAPYPCASWQLLFFGGLVIAWTLVRRPALRLPRGTVVVSALVVAGCIALAASDRAATLVAGGWVSRPLLGPLRLVELAALAQLAFAAVDRWLAPLGRRLGWLLLPYGRNALPAFLLHIPFGWLLLVTPGVAHDDAWRKPVALAVILLLLPVVRHPAARRWLAP